MDRDRRLAEMTGMWDDIDGHTVCPNFSTPEWRAKLMDWAVEQEWYWDFEEWITNEKFPDTPEGIMFTQYLWRNLPDLIFSYFEEIHEEKMSR